MSRSSNKKERLIVAAKTLIHQQGFNQTSLADIAHDSGVPLGNVYYYFKTKEEIAFAVISEHDSCLKQLIQHIETQESDPCARLILLLDLSNDSKEMFAKYGCPVSSLCQELDKKRNVLSDKVDSVLKHKLLWVIEQFHLMGKHDSTELGQQLISCLAGCTLLSNALNDPEVFETQVNRIKYWVKSV